LSNQIEEIISSLREYKEKAISLVKTLNLDKSKECIRKSVSAQNLTKSLGLMMDELRKVEDVSYTLSIMKIEARSLSDSLPEGPLYQPVRMELKGLFSILGEAIVLTKSRYEFLQTVFTGIRSINTNFRSLNRSLST